MMIAEHRPPLLATDVCVMILDHNSVFSPTHMLAAIGSTLSNLGSFGSSFDMRGGSAGSGAVAPAPAPQPTGCFSTVPNPAAIHTCRWWRDPDELVPPILDFRSVSQTLAANLPNLRILGLDLPDAVRNFSFHSTSILRLRINAFSNKTFDATGRSGGIFDLKMPNLTELVMQNCCPPAGALAKSVAQCPKLGRFNLHKYKLADVAGPPPVRTSGGGAAGKKAAAASKKGAVKKGADKKDKKTGTAAGGASKAGADEEPGVMPTLYLPSCKAIELVRCDGVEKITLWAPSAESVKIELLYDLKSRMSFVVCVPCSV